MLREPAEGRVGLNRVPVANGGRKVEVFSTGQEYYTGQADRDPEMDRGLVHTLGVRSLYAVPLRANGSIRGILVAESVHPDRFSPAERDFFEVVSRWVVVVAHRAELHETVARQTLDEARRQVAEEMLETVAHDLQNLITPIKGEVDLLRRRRQRGTDDGDIDRIGHVSSSLERLSGVVSDLLDASRLEGGLFSLTRRPADLVDIVHGVAEDVTTADRPIDVRTPQELIVEADATRLAQALGNLIGNAIKHTPDGVPIVISVGHQQRADGAWAVVEVHDEGPGIPADLLPRVFARHAAAGETAGLGLGLYLARGIATAHGGELTVVSAAGTGTTFTLSIPMASSPAG